MVQRSVDLREQAREDAVLRLLPQLPADDGKEPVAAQFRQLRDVGEDGAAACKGSGAGFRQDVEQSGPAHIVDRVEQGFAGTSLEEQHCIAGLEQPPGILRQRVVFGGQQPLHLLRVDGERQLERGDPGALHRNEAGDRHVGRRIDHHAVDAVRLREQVLDDGSPAGLDLEPHVSTARHVPQVHRDVFPERGTLHVQEFELDLPRIGHA